MATGIREEEDGRQREGREVELTLLTHSGVGACSGRGSGFSSTLVDALGFTLAQTRLCSSRPASPALSLSWCC